MSVNVVSTSRLAGLGCIGLFARAGNAAIAVLALSSLAGCGASIFHRANGYDAQGCAEEALRRDPDPATSEVAKTEFELSCRAGDPAGCSALGVVYETGHGAARNPNAARKLYDRACQAGNQRGCVNLGRLSLAKNDPTKAEIDAATKLFAKACDEGESSGCGELGRFLAQNKGKDRDVVQADSMLHKACDKNVPRACFDLAEIYRGGIGEDPRHAVELYVKSCVAGYQPACLRLDGPGQSRVATR